MGEILGYGNLHVAPARGAGYPSSLIPFFPFLRGTRKGVWDVIGTREGCRYGGHPQGMPLPYPYFVDNLYTACYPQQIPAHGEV